MTLTGWLVMAAALMIGITACSSSSDIIDEQPTPTPLPDNGKYTMTVKASKGGVVTRALVVDGNDLKAFWDGNEVVTVKEGDNVLGTLAAIPDASDNTTATLSGKLDNAPTGTEVKLELCSTDYDNQDGTLNYIASHCDYATATVTVTVSGKTITASDADFVNKNAITKFTFKDGDNALMPSQVIVTPTTGNPATDQLLAQNGISTFTFNIPDQTYANGNTDLFFAMPGLPSSMSDYSSMVKLNITATVGSNIYTYTRSGYLFAPSQYYSITVKMSKLYTCSSSDWSAKVAAFNAETSANPTLQLTENIDIFRHNFILTRSNGILDLNGHTLSALDVRNNVEDQSITIKNGTISGSGDVAIDGHPDWADFYKGTVILENLTVNKMIFVDGHQYIINSGTYNEKIFNVTTSGYPGKLIINGGKFLLSIHGEYSGVTYGTYELRGGKYAVRPQDSWCATGYSVKANTDDDSATYPWIVSEGTQSIPELGDLYYSDGTYSSTLVSGKTPIGVIAYIDQSGTTDDEITEKSNGGGHGLVLCLKNAASNLVWHTTREWVFSESVSVQNTAALKRYSDVSGYSLTSTLIASENASTAFPAAWQAKNYSELTTPSGSTGWFLPSAQQWVRMMTGLGGLSEDAIVYGFAFDSSHSAIDLWNAALAKAGSGNYDSMSQSSMYWTSSECDLTNAIRVVVDQSNATSYGPSLYINGFVKDGNGSGYCRVRPVLAF